MPWYKFEARHGPGHQSHFTEYDWSDLELNDRDLDEWYKDKVSGLDWPKGKVVKIDYLPDEIIGYKIEEYKEIIEDARHMLEVLGAGEE